MTGRAKPEAAEDRNRGRGRPHTCVAWGLPWIRNVSARSLLLAMAARAGGPGHASGGMHHVFLFVPKRQYRCSRPCLYHRSDEALVLFCYFILLPFQIAKTMYLEKQEWLTIWNEGNTNLSSIVSYYFDAPDTLTSVWNEIIIKKCAIYCRLVFHCNLFLLTFLSKKEVWREQIYDLTVGQ